MKIKEYCRLKKIRSKDFHKKIGLDQSTTSNCDGGRRSIRLKNAVKIFLATNGAVGLVDMLNDRDKYQLVEEGWLVADVDGEYRIDCDSIYGK